MYLINPRLQKDKEHTRSLSLEESNKRQQGGEDVSDSISKAEGENSLGSLEESAEESRD